MVRINGRSPRQHSVEATFDAWSGRSVCARCRKRVVWVAGQFVHKGKGRS